LEENAVVELRENERKTLLALKELGGKGQLEQIIELGGLDHAAAMRASLSLTDGKITRMHEQKQTKVTLNAEGKYHAEKGLPERRLLKSLIKMGGEARIQDLVKDAALENRFLNIALGWLHKNGWASLNKERQTLKAHVSQMPPLEAYEKLLSLLHEKTSVFMEELDAEMRMAVEVLKRRQLAEIEEKTLRILELTEEGWKLVKAGIKAVEEVSQLTPELVATGRWRKVKLRKYNIKAPVACVWPGKKHPYFRFLDELKRKMVALGFKEMAGPIVEFMFFNCDSLYMPQDHPAREIHDVYFVKKPAYGNLKAYGAFLNNVKKTHENGWKTGSKGWDYKFSVKETKRLMLRSQGTALSARTLMNKNLEIPGKYFSISRCYRPDVIDKTHLTEFNQVEGIVVAEDLNLRDLFGLLKMFALEIAEAEKVKFRPGYFPFTEPSVELVAYKKGFGWAEFGGAGIFRPEVTLPLGVKVPVLAWGLGVDRLFMMKAGIDDIRYLFTQDLDWIRRKGVI
jgi:phenylalanyl-tRNA synthetase alpha chain